MTKFNRIMLGVMTGMLLLPAAAQADSRFSVNIGEPHYYHHHHHSNHYRPYPTAYYVAPQPVFIEQPPQVVYVQNTVPQPVIQPIVIQEQNLYCREYTRNVFIGRRVMQSYGTACLQPDGSWQVMN